MSDDEEIDRTNDMTEQIEATVGPITVYVSSDDNESAREMFDHAFGEAVDTYMDMADRKRDRLDDGDDSTKTFG